MKGLNIPSHDATYVQRRKPVITDASLEDANRIIFSPWETIAGYGEPATESVIDIPGNIGGLSHSHRENKTGRPTITPDLTPVADKQTNKLNSSAEDDKSNKSSSFSQLVIRVQSVHFHKVSTYN